MANKYKKIADQFASLQRKGYKNLTKNEQIQHDYWATKYKGKSDPIKYKEGITPAKQTPVRANSKHTKGGLKFEGYSQDGLFDKIGTGWNAGVGTLKAGMKPNETMLGVAASHAVRGAVVGGLGGGTMEAAQGGSFWDGAKAGAFNGAVGWGGYRMGMRMTGATSMNPFAGLKGGKEQGLLASAGRMTNVMSGDVKVAKSAAGMLNQAQRSGWSDAVTKGLSR
jgi:hypothetical protein